MYKIAFRVDGGPSIGMGHLIRCISLAKEFEKTGQQVFFISKAEKGIELIRESGFPVFQLDEGASKNEQRFFYGNHFDLKAEEGQLVSFLKEYHTDALIIDSYNVTQEYFLKLKPYIRKLVYIDDIDAFPYPVDILINGNIYGSDLEYRNYTGNELFLLGTRYNLIREEFKDLSKRIIKDSVQEIMITTGGSDPYDMSSKILELIIQDKDLNKLKVNLIIGNGFFNKSKLLELATKKDNLCFYENIKNVSEVMLKSDMAISSGGSTLYELCACGTPTISFIIAENQVRLVEKMSRLGYIKSLGWYNSFCASDATQKLKAMICQPQELKAMSQRMQSLVDGLGTKRVVESIVRILAN